MKEKLRSLFAFQQFIQEPHLKQLIGETENRCPRELADDDLACASAAGSLEQLLHGRQREEEQL